MSKHFLFSIIISTLALFWIIPTTTFAALNASVSLDPTNPPPNSSVTLTLVSYSFDVNQSSITWTSNGVELLRGLGQKKLVVKTGDVGTSIPVRVKAISASGDSIELDITISPQSVTLLYESEEGYVPLFYEGLSLPSEESLVKFVAVPNVSVGRIQVPPSSLSYSWYLDSTFIDDASGIGKQVAEFKLSALTNNSTVRVVVRGPNGVLAEKRLTVYPREPLPMLYVYDDVLGVQLNKPVSRRYETTKPFTISLEPYYMSTNGTLSKTISSSWNLDGKPVTPDGRLLALQPKEDSFGLNKLSITISNSARRLQKAVLTTEFVFDTRK